MDRTPWGKLLLVCAAGVPAAIALGKIGVVGPLLRPDLGLSLPQLGLAVSAITVVAALLGTPAGLWTGGYGPRRTLLAGLAVMAVGTGLRLLSVTVLAMPLAALPAFRSGGALAVVVAAAAAIMLANGVAVAAAFAALPEVVSDPGQIALAIGVMTQLGSTGTLLGAPLFGAVVAAADWSAFAPLLLLVTLLTLGLLLVASAWRSRVASP